MQSIGYRLWKLLEVGVMIDQRVGIEIHRVFAKGFRANLSIQENLLSNVMENDDGNVKICLVPYFDHVHVLIPVVDSRDTVSYGSS